MATKLKLPSNVSSITITGAGALTPSGGFITGHADSDHSTLTHPTTRPSLVKTAANGDITVKFPSIVTGITIGGVAYTPDGNGLIVVPAAVATAYLEELKYLRCTA